VNRNDLLNARLSAALEDAQKLVADIQRVTEKQNEANTTTELWTRSLEISLAEASHAIWKLQ
jgi:hypothetical protein